MNEKKTASHVYVSMQAHIASAECNATQSANTIALRIGQHDYETRFRASMLNAIIHRVFLF